MSEEKKNWTAEEIIAKKLTGDARKNALDFVAFLRANHLAMDAGENEWDGGGMGWAVGGTVGNSLGYMLVNGEAQMPGPWTIWFNTCDFGDDPADDTLKKTAWAHVSPCGKCHPGWADCGGGDRTIWGKDFEHLCHSPLAFTDPDADLLQNVEKLILRLC